MEAVLSSVRKSLGLSHCHMKMMKQYLVLVQWPCEPEPVGCLRDAESDWRMWPDTNHGSHLLDLIVTDILGRER